MVSSTFIDVTDPQAPPAGLENPVVAIGNFDGVHRGHRGVIAWAQALAEKLARPCVLVTFEPHPSDFFARERVIFRLTPHQAKARQLARLGLAGMVVFTFDAALSGLSAEEFVTDVLIRRLNVAAVVVGYDFHFGAKRRGTPDFLRESGKAHGFEVVIVERIAQDEAGTLDAVSSTATRVALENGDVALATRLLGHPYFVQGLVQHGRKIGRTLGFPTANIALDPSCRLKHGIYAVTLEMEGKVLPAVASFGTRPMYDNGPPLLEVHVLDFDGDLYDKAVEVAFVAYLRAEAKFESIYALVAQMERDKAQARALLRG